MVSHCSKMAQWGLKAESSLAFLLIPPLYYFSRVFQNLYVTFYQQESLSYVRYTKTKTAWRRVDGPFGLSATCENSAVYSQESKTSKNVIWNKIEKQEMEIIVYSEF